MSRDIDLNSPIELLDTLEEDVLENLITAEQKSAAKTRSKSLFFSAKEQECIVDFMQNHTGLPRHANMGPKANQLSGKLWLNLTRDVSNLGIQRSVSQVLYQWTNMKRKVTDANCERKKAHQKTGNTAIPPSLSPLYERVLAVIGKNTGLPIKNGKAGTTSHSNKKHEENNHSNTIPKSTSDKSTSKKELIAGQSTKQKRIDDDIIKKKAKVEEKEDPFYVEARTNNQLFAKIHEELVALRECFQESNRLKKLELSMKNNGRDIDDNRNEVDNVQPASSTASPMRQDSGLLDYTDIEYLDDEFIDSSNFNTEDNNNVDMEIPADVDLNNTV